MGYPDERMGEEIAAAIVLKRPSLRALQGSALTVPGLSLYETPKKIFFVDSLPKTSTGKIQPAATMPVTLVMLEAIRDYYYKTGKKI